MYAAARRRARSCASTPFEKGSKQQLQETQLQAVDTFVLHQLGVAQRGDFPLRGVAAEQRRGAGAAREIRHRFDIQIDRIAIEDRVGQIRAGVVRLAVGNGVQRVERDEAGAGLLGHPVDNSLQIGGIAASPVPMRAQAVEADREPGRAARFEPRRLIGPCWAHDQPRRRAGIARHLDREFVIAERKIVGEPDALADQPFAAQHRFRGGRQFAQRDPQLPRAARLRIEFEQRFGRRFVLGERNRDLGRRFTGDRNQSGCKRRMPIAPGRALRAPAPAMRSIVHPRRASAELPSSASVKRDAAVPRCPNSCSRCPRLSRLRPVRLVEAGCFRQCLQLTPCDNRIVDEDLKFQPSLPSELFARIDNEDMWLVPKASSPPRSTKPSTGAARIPSGRCRSAWLAAPSR